MVRFSRKYVIEYKIKFEFLYNFLSENFSLYEELSEIWSYTYIGLQAKYSLFLSDFQMFYRKIFEKYVSNFTNIRPVGLELFRAKG